MTLPETEESPAPVVPTQGTPPTTEPGPPAPGQDEQAETVPDPGDIEEGRDKYRPGGFHPVYIGEVYAGKYQVMNKVGYGVYSTVWLVKDLTKPDGDEHKYMALKVLSAECYDEKNPVFEREILTHLRDGDRSLWGYRYVCHLVDDFEHQGPNGNHVCLVFELMGENLSSFGTFFKEDMVPYSVMRRFTLHLVLALSYAHEHNVIHTDIKPDNIFVRFQDRSRIETGYLAKVPVPQQDRAEARYTPVRSTPFNSYYYGEAKLPRFTDLEIALGDWGVSSWATQHLTERIQPVALRSPEVLLEAPWDKSTDLWNLGAVILEVYRAVRMFDGRGPPDGRYDARVHAAEMIELFGPFPKELLDKGNPDIVQRIFNDEGNLKDGPAVRRVPLASEGYMPGLEQEARDSFADFLTTMMKINPVDRPTTDELVKHSWIGVIINGKG
ncbi:kinase-like domain-containing protein [Chaetomium fimeti]|uniref:non-specific serine/threonine protein kinase n=1 Tax=Chaetomium fimeti TaxID=1854472 RepID=A0AAE0HBJ8_9PEZI|nr:kinase-like domain-containing protein [Chaetomium fimeti]